MVSPENKNRFHQLRLKLSRVKSTEVAQIGDYVHVRRHQRRLFGLFPTSESYSAFDNSRGVGAKGDTYVGAVENLMRLQEEVNGNL